MPATQGYLKFQVDVQNLSSSAKTVIYEVDWLDRDGVSLGIVMEEPPWTLFPHETLPWPSPLPRPPPRISASLFVRAPPVIERDAARLHPSSSLRLRRASRIWAAFS